MWCAVAGHGLSQDTRCPVPTLITKTDDDPGHFGEVWGEMPMLLLQYQFDILHPGRRKHIFCDQPVRDELPVALELVVVSGRRHDDQSECGKHEGALATVAAGLEGLDRRSIGGESGTHHWYPYPKCWRRPVFMQTLIDPSSRQDLAPIPRGRDSGTDSQTSPGPPAAASDRMPHSAVRWHSDAIRSAQSPTG